MLATTTATATTTSKGTKGAGAAQSPMASGMAAAGVPGVERGGRVEGWIWRVGRLDGAVGRVGLGMSRQQQRGHRVVGWVRSRTQSHHDRPLPAVSSSRAVRWW